MWNTPLNVPHDVFSVPCFALSAFCSFSLAHQITAMRAKLARIVGSPSFAHKVLFVSLPLILILSLPFAALALYSFFSTGCVRMSANAHSPTHALSLTHTLTLSLSSLSFQMLANSMAGQPSVVKDFLALLSIECVVVYRVFVCLRLLLLSWSFSLPLVCLLLLTISLLLLLTLFVALSVCV
jgi:hypothetical protein